MNQIRNNPQAAAKLRGIFSNNHERGKVTIETEKFTRKAFSVDAVQVTPENFAQVAEWCEGEILIDTTTPERRQYIKIRVHHPLTERQTKAYVNDWVLWAGKGYKVYTPKAFAKTFEPIFRADPVSEKSIGTVRTTEEILPGITATRDEPVYTRPEVPVAPEATSDDWAPPGTDESIEVVVGSRIHSVTLVEEGGTGRIERVGPIDESVAAEASPTVAEVEPASVKEDVYVTDAEFATLGEANLLDENKNYIVVSEAEKLALDVANQKEI